MCNLYSITRTQEVIRRAFRVMRDLTGNIPGLPAVFPDTMAPVARAAHNRERELTMMRWGFSPPPNLGTAPVTNVPNLKSPYWRSLLIAGACPVLYISTAYGEDVQAYCAKVGDDDSVKTIPADLVVQARTLFFYPSSAVSDAEVRDSTSFRCMSGGIWLCNYGANLVCDKANVSRESAGATAFCKENPGSDSVPMAATGHDTIYSRKCAGNKSRISRQTLTVDPRGFIAENWKRVKR